MKRAMVVGVVLGIAAAAAACGIVDDPYGCRDFCDKYRACDPSLSDPEWDACEDTCFEKGYSDKFVDCVVAQTCDSGFQAAVDLCRVDPAEMATEALSESSP